MLTNMVDLNQVLRAAVTQGASDIHIEAGAPPSMRISGQLLPMPDQPVLSATDARDILFRAMTDAQREEYEENLEIDTTYDLPGVCRFRVNVHQQKGHVGAALRTIPLHMPTVDQLGLPPLVANIPALTHGLVLVTGPTGSGKTTTLAALLNEVNETRDGHIVTVEDPIEFVHEHKRCVITQREVGEDTYSFEEALRRALRQDPDIIMVGELRDRETMSVALRAASTGHLVFASTHTASARETITRIVESFPGDERPGILSQLSQSLRMIVTQTLCRTIDGEYRVLAAEILVASPAIRALIKDGKVSQIQSAIQSSQRAGMRTMAQSLADLVDADLISLEEALDKCNSAEDLALATGYPDTRELLKAAGVDPNGPVY